MKKEIVENNLETLFEQLENLEKEKIKTEYILNDKFNIEVEIQEDIPVYEHYWSIY